jgi:diacylglycerol kinase
MEQIKKNKTYEMFKNAFAGLNYFFTNERNGRTQFFIAVFTVILGIFLNITKYEWIAVLLCIGIVLSAEMMNSALEKLCDYTQSFFNLQIKIVKDVAAGAVLFISIISAIIGALIFFPKLWQLL